VQAAKPCQSLVLADQAKSSSPHTVRFLFLFTAEKFSADLTIAVLGRFAFETYHPDTLLALADKKIPMPLSDCLRA